MSIHVTFSCKCSATLVTLQFLQISETLVPVLTSVGGDELWGDRLAVENTDPETSTAAVLEIRAVAEGWSAPGPAVEGWWTLEAVVVSGKATQV